ncbi:MAG: ATP-binding domain-containing protein [Deltaproteobacteria bacterium]|nr:ATP-binding domain-containing protein [Deltaproteobacteria bacterium]
MQLLGRVRRYLEEHPEPPAITGRDVLREMAELRESAFDAKEEDLPALFQHYDQLASRARVVGADVGRPPVDPDCPYFAHLRLQEDRRTRDLFIGRGTRIEPGLRIVDWRDAPVSTIFYRYQEGEEFEEQVGDVVLQGTVAARRIVGVAGGELQRVDCPQGSWVREDGAWIPLARPPPSLSGGAGSAYRAGDAQKSRLGTGLAHRADKHLPEIAALIDPRQFDLVTRPGSGIVAIRGTAGSGKTTVALHRIAWLVHADPERFRPSRMLVLVWGRALKNYVAHVLPALGVEGVRVETWEAWARSLRLRLFSRLPKACREDSPGSLQRIKLHPVFETVLERRIRTRLAPPGMASALDDFVSLLSDTEATLRVFEDLAPGALPRPTLVAAGREMADQASRLRAWLDGDRSAGSILDCEDDALLLRAWQLRVGPLRGPDHRPVRHAHVLVDEVQDFAPLELRVALGTLDDGRCATLAGDTAQHIVDVAGFTDWKALFDHLDVQGTVVETLRVSYRSTREIAEFGRRLLGPHADAEPPPRTIRAGPPVEILRFTDHGALVALLADTLRNLSRSEPLASVALIAPDEACARLVYEGLLRAEVPRLRLVLDQDFSFAPGVEVTLARDVKGLEFDYVVLLDTSARHYPDTDTARRVLHVGATRAIHQLWVTVTGTPAAAVRPFLGAPG